MGGDASSVRLPTGFDGWWDSVFQTGAGRGGERVLGTVLVPFDFAGGAWPLRREDRLVMRLVVEAENADRAERQSKPCVSLRSATAHRQVYVDKPTTALSRWHAFSECRPPMESSSAPVPRVA